MENVTKQEFKDLVSAVVANGQRIEALEASNRQKLEDRIYDSLPISVIAEMVQDECDIAMAELGLESEI